MKTIKEKKIKKRCWNCSHQGEVFKAGLLGKMHHCQHPKYSESLYDAEHPYITLMEVYDCCDDYKEVLNENI